METNLRGKVALITGAGGGIGHATALLMAAEGAAIAAADIAEQMAEQTVASVRAHGGSAAAFALDVTAEESVRVAVRAVIERLGPIDVLVNCAGIYRTGSLQEVDPAAWDSLMQINLRGTYLTCRQVLPGMLERGRGSIVNLSSISGRTKSVLAAPSYVASKAGVIGLTMAIASQSAGRGVRANTVAPGPVDTDMIRNLPEQEQAHLLTTLPMGRLATAQEIAQAIAFLASDAASYITGETLNVNGGAFMV